MDKIIVEKIQKKLKAVNSNISDSDLKESTEIIYNKISSKNKKFDEDGHEIVAENVKIIIDSGISSVNEIKE